VAEIYLRDLQRRRMRRSTRDTAYRTLKILCRIFGEDRLVGSINDRDVSDCVQAREAEGVRAISIAKELRYLRSALSAAGVPRPCKLGAPRVVLRKAKRLRRAELKRLLEVAPARLRLLLVTAAATGMRNSELRHLTWGGVDLEAGTFEVTAKEHLGFRPKSGQERGPFPLPAPALEALRALHAVTKFPGPEHPVFLRTEKRRRSVPWEQAALCRAVKEVFEAAGVARVSGLHALRKTWASELLDRGFGVHDVQELGGWATPDVLLPHYASSSADRRRAAAAAIGELLAGRG
jgi:integrase